MGFCLGVDLGGTNVKMGVFYEDGTLRDKWEIPTNRANSGASIPRDIAESLLERTERLGISAQDTLGVGIGVPGQVWPDGTVDAENLGWERFPLIAGIEAATGFPVAADNDANVAAAGEYWQGAGRGYNSLVLVTLGTGVGGGIVVDGQCLSGAHMSAGEIGHVQVEPKETLRCACGGFGCLEQYASATGCARMAREELHKTSEPSVLRGLRDIDAKAVWDASKAGDRLALRVADRFCDYLARGLAILAHTVDPEIFAVGGGVSKAGQLLIDMTREKYRSLALSFCRDTPIVLARLGNDAGIYGAAAMATQKLK